MEASRGGEKKAEEEEGMTAEERAQWVTAEMELMQNYFMGDLEEVVAYNGNRGHYRLTLEGSRKTTTLEWHYHRQYPPHPVDVKVNPGSLNPLEL